MKAEEALELMTRTRNSFEKALEKKAMIPEFLLETFENIRKSHDALLSYLFINDKNEKLRLELEAIRKQKEQLLIQNLSAIADDLSVMNHEAKYIIARNKDNEASMDKLSGEAIQHYARLIEEKIANIKTDINSL